MTTEEKAKAYDDSLKLARDYYEDKNCFEYLKGVLENIFHVLAESEDEKIKKMIINHLTKERGSLSNEDASVAIAWLEKQNKHQQLYIRFGEIPTDEKSKIYQGEEEIGTENGVSVYPAFEFANGNIVLGLSLPITKTTLYTQQHLLEYDNRPCYLVKGDYIGNDSDGQPLINNISIVKKIDNYRIKENEKQGQVKESPILQQENKTCKENVNSLTYENERIRKAILNYFTKCWGNCKDDICGIHVEDVLAWLEKQIDKDKLIKELSKYKSKYTQEILQNHLNSMTNKDDERLRKTTIAFLKEFADKGYENAVECIDWLEMQGNTLKDVTCTQEVEVGNGNINDMVTEKLDTKEKQ